MWHIFHLTLLTLRECQCIMFVREPEVVCDWRELKSNPKQYSVSNRIVDPVDCPIWLVDWSLGTLPKVTFLLWLRAIFSRVHWPIVRSIGSTYLSPDLIWIFRDFGKSLNIFNAYNSRSSSNLLRMFRRLYIWWDLSLHRRLKLGRHRQFLFGHYGLFSFTEDGP